MSTSRKSRGRNWRSRGLKRKTRRKRKKMLISLLSSETCNAKDRRNVHNTSALGVYSVNPLREDNHKCAPSSCGNIHNISYPFRLNSSPKRCGHSSFTLFCENNVTVLHISSGKYLVQSINYRNKTIRVVDPGLHKNNCSSIPRYPLSESNFRYSDSPYFSSSTMVMFFKCTNPVNSSLYVPTAPCINTSGGYAMVGNTTAADLEDGCGIIWMTMMSTLFNYENYANISYQYIHNALVYGFELQYTLSPVIYVNCGRDQWSAVGVIKCYPHSIPGFFRLLLELIQDYVLRPLYRFDFGWLLEVFIVIPFMVRFIFGAPFVIALLIYKWQRRHLSMYSTIEEFLQSEKNFVPIRYSYSDVKKMTSKFTEKLGEGGYGSVFKGKLRSGRFVAIKMLGNKSKANGQDFISEVATIGRIHHVNVVQLVGYCVEGSKHGLVYDFMHNGSLDKYIYSKNGSVPLSCEKMYEIALGVARGIEYLHQGCDMQILHFDIKPHNILLDENFVPKVSDFGLAKLYPTDNSIVTLTAARGTMGYIAPELFYKNIGGVSYKADVYSFGMLLMEMASKRKNVNAFAEHSSQIYFPTWVYDQYSDGKELEMGDVAEEENKIIKNMVITALWCIQMKPSDRPSMKKVIEMLEGDAESQQMPPKPLLFPQQEMHAGTIQDNDQNQACSNRELTMTLSARS